MKAKQPVDEYRKTRRDESGTVRVITDETLNVSKRVQAPLVLERNEERGDFCAFFYY
jgi:hypothetical protein